MEFPPSVRKGLLAGHVAASVGWLGALAVFLAHALAGLNSEDASIVRAAALAMSASAWLVILPLSIAAVVTGVVQALGTPWGFARHYWVIFKLALTVIATAVLLLKLGPISQLAQASQEAAFAATDMMGLRISLAAHAAGGILILVLALVLGVFKPVGLTPWGGMPAGTPRWAKVFALMLAALVFLVLVMVAVGKHGPSAHLA